MVGRDPMDLGLFAIVGCPSALARQVATGACWRLGATPADIELLQMALARCGELPQNCVRRSGGR